jgi:hypothetical protein
MGVCRHTQRAGELLTLPSGRKSHSLRLALVLSGKVDL